MHVRYSLACNVVELFDNAGESSPAVVAEVGARRAVVTGLGKPVSQELRVVERSDGGNGTKAHAKERVQTSIFTAVDLACDSRLSYGPNLSLKIHSNTRMLLTHDFMINYLEQENTRERTSYLVDYTRFPFLRAARVHKTCGRAEAQQDEDRCRLHCSSTQAEQEPGVPPSADAFYRKRELPDHVSTLQIRPPHISCFSGKGCTADYPPHSCGSFRI